MISTSNFTHFFVRKAQPLMKSLHFEICIFVCFFSHFLNSKIGLDRFQNIDHVDSNDLISPQLTYSITHFYISIIIDCLFLYTYVIYLLLECMMLQGCSKGLHSNVKPPEPVKEENPADTNKDEVWERVCFLSSICSLLN